MLANDKQRALAEELGDGAMHLLRIPKMPFKETASHRRILEERGQLLSAPAGRDKNPVLIAFDDVPSDEVEERILERWTQRGIAPHVGTDERLGRPVGRLERLRRRPDVDAADLRVDAREPEGG